MSIPIDNKKLRFLAHMGARGCLGEAVFSLADEIDFHVCSADLGIASGFQRFMEKYPERFINTGIAEQNMIGIAAGIASSDYPVLATSWGAFSSYRCADQIRNYLGIMKSNVKIIGMDSGVTISRFGGCHYTIGDIALLRAIPNLMIISPCDGIEIYQAIETALKVKGPVYVRLTGGQQLPLIHREADYIFKPKKAELLKEGEDVAVIGTGVILEQCIKAVKTLEKEGISCTLINISTLKPFDIEVLLGLVNHKIIVTVEEHNVLGGLGSAVAELLMGMHNRPKQIMLGISDIIPSTGTYEYILEECGLLGSQIAERIIDEMGV